MGIPNGAINIGPLELSERRKLAVLVVAVVAVVVAVVVVVAVAVAVEVEPSHP